MKNTSSSSTKTTRERVIDAAMELFAESGYEGCTVQDIAKAVGIKAASLYAHFAGKDEIFDATLSAAIERWKVIVDSAFANAEGIRGLEDGVIAIIAEYMSAMSDSTSYRFWTRVYVFPPEHILGKRFSELMKLDETFARRLKAACVERAGTEATAGEISDFASSLTHFAMGILVNSMGKAPTAKEMRIGISLLTRGLMAGKKTGKGANK